MSYEGFHLKCIITLGRISVVLELVFSQLFTPVKFLNLLFIFVDYGNIKFQNY